MNNPLNFPEADKIYVVSCRHVYETDSSGNVTSAAGQLELSPAARSCYQQGLAGDCGLPSDEGGHLIGAQFQGVGARINLVPQDWQLNRGANSLWRAMEQEWAEAIIDGRKVVVDMDVIYPASGASRPDSFTVRWTIDGEPHDKTFINQSGG